MDYSIDGKVALISGGTSGIGLASAQALLNEGAHVVVFSRSAENIEKAKESLEVKDSKLATFQCDLADENAVDEMLGKIESDLGSIDIFVGSSGGPSFGKAQDLNKQDIEKAMETNFISLVTLTNKLIPSMRESKWGRIVYVTTSGVIQPIAHLALSNFARSALTSYTKTLANDVAIDEITVNSVIPGKIDTQRLREVTTAKAKSLGISYEDQKEKEFSEIPAGRYGTPEEIANVIAFLCSKGASYLTGLKIPVDGGMIKSV